MELLEKAFHDNERLIKEELMKETKIYPQEFAVVDRKISNLDEEISMMLANLRGALCII